MIQDYKKLLRRAGFANAGRRDVAVNMIKFLCDPVKGTTSRYAYTGNSSTDGAKLFIALMDRLGKTKGMFWWKKRRSDAYIDKTRKRIADNS